ncbi:amidinotransferase [Candidatus Nomurabacteria bacterium]|nr:amidinotransferase [Candidatus Nomurabacteria bacterium]
MSSEAKSQFGKVWSCNEWDPLEEVIVGTVKYATVPKWTPWLASTTPSHAKWFFEKYGGQPFPEEMTENAEVELDNLSNVLTELGVTVHRPTPFDFGQEYRTPWWDSQGLYAAMPRDVMMVVGDTIVEAPMAWRSRYFEIFAFRDLIEKYFEGGAKWLAAPKSSMSDSFYRRDYDPENPTIDGVRQFVISEREVSFDAADFTRVGKDIFVQKSNVTNTLGIEWVRRHIGDEYTIHEVEFGDEHPMHIDTTIVPLAPGKLMINPSWVTRDQIPKIFDSWEIIEAPEPVHPYDKALYFSSDWLTMNFLSIDERRILVEENEAPLIELLRKHGFEPIPIPFRNFYPFGGSIHCATADIRRRGELKSYF